MKKEVMQCSKCPTKVCAEAPTKTVLAKKAPSWCPLKTKAEIIQKAVATSKRKDKKLLKAAVEVEKEAYVNVFSEAVDKAFDAEKWGLKPFHTRVLETINFARKMGYKKIGIACCFSCLWDAKVLANAFINRGIEVIVRGCKAFQVKNSTFLNLKDEETLVPGGFQPMCNPIAQVDTLVDSGCEMVVAFGECSGHDALAGKYSSVPYSLIGVKDRVLAHNPVIALTETWSPFYKKLTRKEPLKIEYVKGHYRVS